MPSTLETTVSPGSFKEFRINHNTSTVENEGVGTTVTPFEKYTLALQDGYEGSFERFLGEGIATTYILEPVSALDAYTKQLKRHQSSL